MDLLARHPRIEETLISLAILGVSYLAAKLLSILFTKVLARAAAQTATTLDDRLVAALQRPLAYVLFLAGAFVAVSRLPITDKWEARLDSLLYVAAILLVALALGRAYVILLRWYMTESRAATDGGFATEFGPLASKLGKVFITAVAGIAVLQHLGVNVSSLLVSLGVGSLAVGLAAQDTLANMIAGFTLLLDRPFRIGDRIQLATGELGDVQAIGMRATRIKTPDETTVVVPNSVLVKERVVNMTRPGRQITTRVEVGVAYDCDLAQAKKILADAALASRYVDPSFAPLVVVTRFADNAVVLRVAFWARDYTEQGLAASEVYEEILKRLDAAEIEIPIPTRRVIHHDAAHMEAGPRAPEGGPRKAGGPPAPEGAPE